MDKAKSKKDKFRRKFLLSIPIYGMMLPGLIYLFCNNYMPMFGIVIAFKKINWQKGIWKSPWVGLDNFQFLFASKDTARMIRNTVLYNVLFIILGTVLAITVAILLKPQSQILWDDGLRTYSFLLASNSRRKK